MIDHPNHPPPKRSPKRSPNRSPNRPPTDVRPTGIPSDIPGVFRKTGNLVAALLESASQGIVSTDQAGRIVLANRRAGEMFGYTSQELLGAPVELLLPESKRAAHGRQRDDYFQRPRTRPMGIGLDLSGRRKDGTEFPVEVSLSTVETEEGVFGIAFISDITLRKTLEEQLMHAQKMEAVGRLAGGVAHDFNNMLTVIAGYNRMILDEISTLDPLRGYAEEILKAADRAGALTNQLLAFSRRQIMQPRVIDLNAVIGQTENMLRRLIGEDIQLVMSLSADTGNIKADPNHIEQAIVNLAVNSRDAMPLGGRITIETSHTQIDETYAKTHMGVKPGEFVMIAVSDTGHGMDSATRQNIFEPFFTTKQRGKGTGLGLATVYGIVKQSGGDIWVYSEPGHGTTFKLYFPRVADPVSPGAMEDPQSLHRAGGETVMLVEDETQVRDLEVRILTQLGYSVLAAANGEEAIGVSRTYRGEISLLVTDVVMPNMSGKQVADALLASRPGIRILYLSGYTENTVVNHGVLDTNVDFLSKPFSREALARKIREILSR
jgi:two-component system, cell cycle sensor histidine kinase and response regulator CckA